MALRLQPAGRIDRQPAVLRRPTLQHRARTLAWRGQAHRLVFQQFGDGEAVVRFDERQVVQLHVRRVQRPPPRLARRPRTRVMSRLLIGRKSFTCTAARKRTALPIARAVSSSASTSAAAPSDTSEQSVRFSGGATYGFFSLTCAAELEAEVLAHLRIGIVDAVLVVLRRDRRQRVGLVAVALEIALGDAPEHAGETGGDVGFFLLVAGLQQDVADLARRASRSSSRRRSPARTGRGRRRGNRARHAPRPSRTRRRSRSRVIGRKRSSGTCCSTSEAGKSCFEKPLLNRLTKVASISCRRDAGIVDRGAGDAADQRFDIGVFQLAERRMRPADDAGFGHGFGLLIWWRRNLARSAARAVATRGQSRVSEARPKETRVRQIDSHELRNFAARAP